jgi:hypothetical protein
LTYRDISKRVESDEAFNMPPMSKAQEYRKHAEECRQRAEQCTTASDNNHWLTMAEEWLRMADDAAVWRAHE